MALRVYILLNYKHLENHILSVIKAQFFVQIVGGAFFLILNIYLAKNSFSDSGDASIEIVVARRNRN